MNKLLKNPKFLFLVQEQFEQSRDFTLFLAITNLAICNLDDNRFLAVDDFERARVIVDEDSKLHRLQDLSTLDITLVVAMKKLVDQSSFQFTFDQVYEQYKLYAADAGHRFSKQICLKSFNHLIDLEIATPCIARGGGFGHNSSSGHAEFHLVQLMVQAQQLLEAIKVVNCPTKLEKWALNWLQ